MVASFGTRLMNISRKPAVDKPVQKKVEPNRAKLKNLKAALAKGNADLAAGRVIRLGGDDDIDVFFANL